MKTSSVNRKAANLPASPIGDPAQLTLTHPETAFQPDAQSPPFRLSAVATAVRSLSNAELNSSPLLTIPEAAALMNRTPSAVRHKIFQAESVISTHGNDDTTEFRRCIVRPPGERRVFLHRHRLAALIESWAAKLN